MKIKKHFKASKIKLAEQAKGSPLYVSEITDGQTRLSIKINTETYEEANSLRGAVLFGMQDFQKMNDLVQDLRNQLKDKR